jgi:hypothetical protein
LSQPADTPDTDFYTFGGSSVTVTRVYAWYCKPGSVVPRWTPPNRARHWDSTLFPVEIEPISPMQDAILDAAVFAEQRKGEEDACVTIASSQLPGVPHQTLPIHHGEAFFDEPMFGAVATFSGRRWAIGGPTTALWKSSGIARRLNCTISAESDANARSPRSSPRGPFDRCRHASTPATMAVPTACPKRTGPSHAG